jgi:hypothetical protein
MKKTFKLPNYSLSYSFEEIAEFIKNNVELV